MSGYVFEQRYANHINWLKKNSGHHARSFAISNFNWDIGEDFLVWAVRTYEIDQAAIVHLADAADPGEYYGLSEADVLARQSESFTSPWLVLAEIDKGWKKGKFRKQALTLPERELKRGNPFNEEVREPGSTAFSFLWEMPPLRASLPLLNDVPKKTYDSWWEIAS